ncbi:MAG: HD domain-containing protein [Deltaproteobacteria bacterium]|nr:HD domain-containing protein [Deltaproteobacteria bacterium]
MDTNHLAFFRKWFSDYVSGYYTDDPAQDQAVRLKHEHTDRVCKEIVMLGQALNLPSQDMLLTETMALFHDLGRFEQYATYGTFEDARSENHAALGLRELVKHDVLSVCSDEEQRLITKAIGYHNVRALPENELERTLFFAKLLRDADKLDIWRVFIDYYDRRYEGTNSTIVLGLPNGSVCSPKILTALHLGRMADTRDMATLNDYKLLQISWVFDVNFEPTFRAVCERRYVEKIAATLPQTREIREVVSTVLAYLQKKGRPNSLERIGKMKTAWS